MVPPSSCGTSSSDLSVVHKELFFHHPLSLSDEDTLELPLSDSTHFSPTTPPLTAAQAVLDLAEEGYVNEDASDLDGKLIEL